LAKAALGRRTRARATPTVLTFTVLTPVSP
jgi:hypothetical protein